MKKLVIFSTIIMLLIQMTSCIKQEATLIYAYLINQSNQNVTVLCYKNGVVLPDDTIRIGQRDTFLFGIGSDRGDIKVPGFSSTYFGDLDDHIEVVFNEEYKVYHYLNVISDSTVPHYIYSDNRSMLNPNNYEFEMTRARKKKINYHFYTFTEDDYEFAKE